MLQSVAIFSGIAGKTHLACAIAVSAVTAGHSAYFTTLDDMVRKLRAADDTCDLNRQMRTYLRSSVLIIDKVGYFPLDRRDARLVFQVIAPPLREKDPSSSQAMESVSCPAPAAKP
jgi:DNA replication protein DnaC